MVQLYIPDTCRMQQNIIYYETVVQVSSAAHGPLVITCAQSHYNMYM